MRMRYLSSMSRKSPSSSSMAEKRSAALAGQQLMSQEGPQHSVQCSGSSSPGHTWQSYMVTRALNEPSRSFVMPFPGIVKFRWGSLTALAEGYTFIEECGEIRLYTHLVVMVLRVQQGVALRGAQLSFYNTNGFRLFGFNVIRSQTVQLYTWHIPTLLLLSKSVLILPTHTPSPKTRRCNIAHMDPVIITLVSPHLFSVSMYLWSKYLVWNYKQFTYIA